MKLGEFGHSTIFRNFPLLLSLSRWIFAIT